MRSIAIALVAVQVGCSAGGSPGSHGDGGGVLDPPIPPNQTSDAPSGPCTVALVPEPRLPIAGPGSRVNVAAHVSSLPGIPQPKWTVTFNGAPVMSAITLGSLGFAVDFYAPSAGIYDVSLELIGAPATCQPESLPLNVEAAGASTSLYRLRIVPPLTTGAPAMEKNIVVKGGGSADIGTPDVGRGQRATFTVAGPDGGVPAYVRFTPQNAPDAIIEAFADQLGRVDVALSPQAHSVLIIPSRDGIAPRRIASWSPFGGGASLVVAAGAEVTGTVRGPDAAPLAGAQVQLSIDGVPSTLVTTAADGGFAVRSELTSGTITVEVTPDAASGLPRLVATSPPSTPGSPQLDLGVPLQVRYAANIARKNLAGAVVRRPEGSPIAGARVMFVGAMVAGMVTTGTGAAMATVTAAGEVRIAATAGSNGALPSVLVPAARLSAVVRSGDGALAVVELDTASSISAIAAPDIQPIAIAVRSASGAQDLPGATLEVVPLGALALAGAPAVHVVAGAGGAVGSSLPAGGRFELRFRDPLGRAAPLVVPDRVISTIETSYQLPAAIQLRGRVKLDGTQAVANAAVQLLCNSCNGLARNRPIAEAVSGITGQFVLAVPDPGTR